MHVVELGCGDDLRVAVEGGVRQEVKVVEIADLSKLIEGNDVGDLIEPRSSYFGGRDGGLSAESSDANIRGKSLSGLR